MYRYCGQLDEPHRTQATSLVTKAIEFRGGHQPPANVPMQLYSLSIEHKEQHRQWLREFIQEHSALFPWFHVPTTAVVYIKNLTWKPKVHNFHRFLRDWEPDVPPTCQCGTRIFRKQTHSILRPSLCSIVRNTPSHLNLQDCKWPTSKQWMEQGQKTFFQWQQRWRVPRKFQDQWNLHLHLLWQEHERHLQLESEARTQQYKQTGQEMRMLRRFVLCPADHHPHQTFIACPCHYHFLLKKTYFEAEVFEQCQIGPLTLRDRLCEAAKQDLRELLTS